MSAELLPDALAIQDKISEPTIHSRFVSSGEYDSLEDIKTAAWVRFRGEDSFSESDFLGSMLAYLDFPLAGFDLDDEVALIRFLDIAAGLSLRGEQSGLVEYTEIAMQFTDQSCVLVVPMSRFDVIKG